METEVVWNYKKKHQVWFDYLVSSSYNFISLEIYSSVKMQHFLDT